RRCLGFTRGYIPETTAIGWRNWEPPTGRASTATRSSLSLRKGDALSVTDFLLAADGLKLEQEPQDGRARNDSLDLVRTVRDGQVILHLISLSLSPREFVAIVGVSGAGKPALMRALSGFRPAHSGLVLVNCVEFDELFVAFRSALGDVPQDAIV